MSYTDLWDKFTEIREFWTENRKVLEEFSLFLKEKSEIDRAYSKGLEKIAKMPIFDKFGTFSAVFQGLKTFYQESYDHLQYHANFIQEDLYTKLKKLVSLHDSSIHEYKAMGKKLIMEREKLEKSHLKSRGKYWKICEANEYFTSKNQLKSLHNEENYIKSYTQAVSHINSNNSTYKNSSFCQN